MTRRRSRRAPAVRSTGNRPAPLLTFCAFSVVVMSASSVLSALSGEAAHAQDDASRRSEGTIAAREVLVRPGETLADVAGRELGSAARGAPLADFNRLAPDAVLMRGQSLRIPIHVPATDEYAQVVFAKGTVLLNGEPVQRGARMVFGDVIRTGDDGFAALQFSSGATTSLQPDTEVGLQRLACRDTDARCLIEIDSDQGEIDVDIDARDEQPVDLRVTTPYATAAVRGTEFVLASDAASMRLAVYDGEVITERSGTAVTVGEGFGSVTQQGEEPGQVRALPSSPVLRNVPARVAGDDRIRLWPLIGIDRYQATLSQDSAGLRTVARFEVDGDTLTFDGIAPAELFLTVRALADGLPGLPTTTRLVVAAIDPALPPPTVTIERQGEEFLVRVEDPAADSAGFEIQLATEAGFLDPLGVDVGPLGQAVFRLDVDTVHARARQLDAPLSVSAFGPATTAR